MAKKNDLTTLRNLYNEIGAVLGEAPSSAAAADSEDAPDYEGMTFNDLKKLCKANGLSTAGSRAELIARLSGEDEADDEDEAPKKSTSKKPTAKGKKPAADEEEDDDEDDEDDDEDEESVQSQVEAATEGMSLEDLAEFCEENGLSSKGKRQALIARIVKAVEAGDIELSDDEDEDDEEPEPPKKSSKKGDSKKSSKKSAPADDEDDDGDEAEETAERRAALKAFDKDTRAQFKKGEIERDDLVEFLCEFHDKKPAAYKKLSDKELLDAYIEASSNLISDEGEIVEEGAYTVNGEPYCCGRPLAYDEDEEKYVCEHCGGEYEADDE